MNGQLIFFLIIGTCGVLIDYGTLFPRKKSISFYKIKSDYGKGCEAGVAKETPQKNIFN